MALVLHLPPKAVAIEAGQPSVFLAGPIQGAPDWQSESVETFEKIWNGDQVLNIFSPRRATLKSDFDYQAQTDWEKAGLRQASKNGVIVFWFAARDFALPYEEGRAYAQTSRVEFGRVFGWKDYKPGINVAIGIEPGYSGSEKYFKTCAAEFNIKIHDNLESLCKAVAESLQK